MMDSIVIILVYLILLVMHSTQAHSNSRYLKPWWRTQRSRFKRVVSAIACGNFGTVLIAWSLIDIEVQDCKWIIHILICVSREPPSATKNCRITHFSDIALRPRAVDFLTYPHFVNLLEMRPSISLKCISYFQHLVSCCLLKTEPSRRVSLNWYKLGTAAEIGTKR